MEEVRADVSYDAVGDGLMQEEPGADEHIEDNVHDAMIGEDIEREASADEDNLSEEAVSEKFYLISSI